MRRTEDNPRRELVPGQSEALLRELHLVSRDGKLHADSLRKLKQVNHLAQLLQPALDDVRARFPHGQLLDAGAGNAYLGFVLYELFLKDSELVLWNVESRPELVARARERAQRLGYSRMQFVPLALEDAAKDAAPPLPPSPSPSLPPSPSGPDSSSPSAPALPDRLHLVTALHACDTATDDALILALRRRADHVAVVPCCQAEVARQLKDGTYGRATGSWPLLWAHPIHRREAGAQLTNVVRALVLEAFGYVVTVTELIGWEHSLKNELILGRRVHKEHRGARAQLAQLLAETAIAPKLVRELCPELLPRATPNATPAAIAPTQSED